jgi:hypothetical protein
MHVRNFLFSAMRSSPTRLHRLAVPLGPEQISATGGIQTLTWAPMLRWRRANWRTLGGGRLAGPEGAQDALWSPTQYRQRPCRGIESQS